MVEMEPELQAHMPCRPTTQRHATRLTPHLVRQLLLHLLVLRLVLLFAQRSVRALRLTHTDIQPVIHSPTCSFHVIVNSLIRSVLYVFINSFTH